MPDHDYLPRRVRRPWRTAARSILGRQPIAFVSDQIEKALAAELRDSASLIRQLAEARAFELVPDVDALVRHLPTTWVHGHGRPFVNATVEGAGNDGEAILTRAMRVLIWSACVGPIEPTVSAEVFSSFSDFDRYVANCLDLVRFDKLAGMVLSPSPQGIVRAPKSRSRKSTKESLHAPL